MHSFFYAMPSRKIVTMPFGTGAFGVFTQNNILIHLFTNQINSL